MGRRSRKRGAPGARRATGAGAVSVGPSGPAAGRIARSKTGRRVTGRPKPLWHPWPLTEIAIALGSALFVLGFLRGADRGSVFIGVGVLMATAGVIELCAREHFSGFSSHTLLLAFLPVVALHTVVRLWVTDAYEGPVSLLVDFGVFGALAMLLLDRFRKARPKPRAR